jgi:hypothetical protein
VQSLALNSTSSLECILFFAVAHGDGFSAQNGTCCHVAAEAFDWYIENQAYTPETSLQYTNSLHPEWNDSTAYLSLPEWPFSTLIRLPR